MENIDKEIEEIATKGADYLQKRFATLHMQVNKCKGEKSYLERFYNSCYDRLVGMLKNENNVLKSCSKDWGDKKSKNFAALMKGFSELEWLNFVAVNNRDTIEMEFNLDRKTVKVHEEERVYFDPFDDDEYRVEDKYL